MVGGSALERCLESSLDAMEANALSKSSSGVSEYAGSPRSLLAGRLIVPVYAPRTSSPGFSSSLSPRHLFKPELHQVIKALSRESGSPNTDRLSKHLSSNRYGLPPLCSAGWRRKLCSPGAIPWIQFIDTAISSI